MVILNNVKLAHSKLDSKLPIGLRYHGAMQQGFSN